MKNTTRATSQFPSFTKEQEKARMWLHSLIYKFERKIKQTEKKEKKEEEKETKKLEEEKELPK